MHSISLREFGYRDVQHPVENTHGIHLPTHEMHEQNLECRSGRSRVHSVGSSGAANP